MERSCLCWALFGHPPREKILIGIGSSCVGLELQLGPSFSHLSSLQHPACCPCPVFSSPCWWLGPCRSWTSAGACVLDAFLSLAPCRAGWMGQRWEVLVQKRQVWG